MSNSREHADALFLRIAQATRDGRGITRESYGAGEECALRILEQEAQAMGLCSYRDALQNVWFYLAEDTLQEPCIIIGSHADSVPQGGNFDGLAGIIAGLLVLKELKKSHHRTTPPVRVLALRGEESAWYGKAYMGSSALLGKLDPAYLLNPHRTGEQTLGEAMHAAGVAVQYILEGKALVQPHQVMAYLELHIEQGPVMVARQWPIAWVTGIRGNIRHNAIRCVGQAGHSGAVPRWLRKDALLAVAELLSRLDEHWRVLLQMGLDMVMTAGICNTLAHSQAVSVIPGEVQFSFEVRSQQPETLARFYDLMRQECVAIEKSRGVSFVFSPQISTPPAQMDALWSEKLRCAAEKKGHKLESMASGAGHDAAVFANSGIPAAMIFIRNENGSHNPDEAMDTDDFLMGVQLMLDALS